MSKPESHTLQAMDTQKNAKGPAGRPTMFSDSLAAFICGEIASGKTLTAICKTPGLPVAATVNRWRRENSQFSADYATARIDQMDSFGDEIIDISDDSSMDTVTKRDPKGREFEAIDHENIQRSRLMVDTRKWLMSKIGPVYADKVDHKHSGEVVHTVELSDRERMRRLATFMLQDQRAEAAGPAIIEHRSTSASPATIETQPETVQASAPPAKPKD